MKRGFAIISTAVLLAATIIVLLLANLHYVDDKTLSGRVLTNPTILNEVHDHTLGMKEGQIIRWCDKYTRRHLKFDLKHAEYNINKSERHKEN